MARFSEPLTNKGRVTFPVPAGFDRCLEEMAKARGIGRAELMRRVTAAAVVADAPTALGKLAKRHREAIEALAELGGA